MEEIDWDQDIWDVINSYFVSTENYLSKHQIESYDTFLDTNISKTIRQFNPIILPYAKDSETEKYKFEVRITIGGKIDAESDVINDGSTIKIGKPNIQEIVTDDEKNIVVRKTLYPNEARLKNLTYKCAITSDVIVEFFTDENSNQAGTPPDLKRYIAPKIYNNIYLTNNLPIMLQSKVCSLSGLSGSSLRLMGECEYDQGGYFIIDGKEKVIVAQERQIENKPYINKHPNDNRYKYSLEVRSAPERKFQPARVSKIFILNKRNTLHENLQENAIRISIPNVNGEIPIFIVFRALGFISDQDICATIVDNFEDSINKTFLSLLEPSIKEAAFINNQRDALEFIESKISVSFMNPTTHRNRRKHFLASILKDHLFPHSGNNNYTKAYYIGYLIKELMLTYLNIKSPTDRDSYIYKRVDISGFLLSAIFRDLYFRIKTKMTEDLNKLYNNHDLKNEGFYWNNFNPSDEEKLGFKNYRFYNIIADRGDDSGGGLPITKVIDTKIMDEGLLYAFKNCWGLKNAPCKQGVVQDMNRLSYLGAVSHIRRVNTPLSKSAKVRAPHSLHLSSFGIMCPDETPDGGNVGLRKNISIFANITSGTDSSNLLRVLYNSGLEDILQHDNTKFNYTKVLLNECLVGYTKIPLFMNRKLKLLKRNALINVYTSIAWYINENIIKISTDSGRGVRPVFIVQNSNILMNHIELEKIRDKTTDYSWYNLIAGKLHTSSKPYKNTDGGVYNNSNELENNLDELEKSAGCIEYIDAEESNVSLIAMYPRDLTKKINKYNYCEIHPAINFGVLASAIPGIEMNQHPRNQFSTGQGKQALGVYTSNFRNRMDTKGQIMYYPQKPLIKSKLAKYLRVDELPHGINAIVAIGCASGYNQEDSIIFNKSSVEKGLFKTTKFRTFSEREEIDGIEKKEFIVLPDPAETGGLKSGNYRKLDENGIIEEGVKVNENDVLVGKCIKSGSTVDGSEKLLDVSQFVKRNEEGFVDKVYSNTGNNNQRYVKVRIRKDKYPEVGDKFCSRHGQKGTIGMLLRAEDMPRTKDGVVPDLIVNPHAFPSRMTIAQFFETLLGKVCMNKGFLSEMVPFSENNIDNVADILENICGFDRHGNEILYSGLTGHQMKVNFFIGPTYYLRLTHQVSDKFQSRDDGLKTALTHQPVGGRALGGGGRIGEMERDCALSHGIASFLKESFMERSDKYKFYISTKTGMISVCNPSKNIFRDMANDETKQYVDESGKTVKKQIDSSDSNFVCIEAPYSFKLFLQEVESMGVAPRLIADCVLKQWKKMNNVDYEKISSISQSYVDNDITTSDIDNTKSLRRFHNQIKYQLLSGASTRNGTLVDFSCGKGVDLHRWYRCKYNKILAIDEDKTNIEGSKSEETSAKSRLKELKNDNDVRLNLWANNSTIDFVVGNPTKPINDTFAEKKYRSQFNTRIKQYGNYFANNVSVLFSIQKYFDTMKNIQNLLSNVSDVMHKNGYFIVTTLDGPSVFNALKKADKNTIHGTVYNYSKNKKMEVWKIRADPKLDLSLPELPYNLQDGFNNNIHVKLESRDKEIKESLVHPSLLISMASTFGLELVNHNVLHDKFPLFDHATGMFSDIYKKYIKLNPDDLETKRLSSQMNAEIKEYSNLHRYFIFKRDSNKVYPYLTYETSQACKNMSLKISYNEPRYHNLNLPHVIALDTYLAQKYITEKRHIIGNVINIKTKYKNCITSNSIEESSGILKDINSKLDNDFYKSFDSKTFSNTLNYIYHYVKVGIYVRIVNSSLVQFVPIFNYSPDNDGLISNNANDIKFKIPSSEDGSLIDSTFEDYLTSKFSHSEISKFVKNDKIKDIYDIELNKKIEDSMLSNKDIILDGINVILGKETHHHLRPKIMKYRSLLENVCIEKYNALSNSEFIINVLHNPIVSVTGEQLRNPFRNILKDHAKHITIEGSILPVIGECEKTNFLDISVPSITDWEFVNEYFIADMCGDSIPIPSKDQQLNNFIGVITNFDGGSDNMRIKLMENINNLGNYDEDNESREYGVDVFIYNPRLNNIYNNGSISYVNSNELEEVSEYDINKFPKDARIHLFIDGFGSDEILSIVSRCPSVLFRIKSENYCKLWFEKHLNAYNIDDEYIGKVRDFNADFVMLNDLSDLRKGIDFVIDNPELAEKLIKNKMNKLQRLFSKETIIDYMQVVLNKIGNKMNSDMISSEIFIDNVEENVDRRSINIPQNLLGILIGKKGSKLNNLQHKANVNITIDRSEIVEEDGTKSKVVTITGGKSGVNIAYNSLLKLASMVTKFIYIEKDRINRFLGAKMEHKKLIELGFDASIYLNLRDNEILNNYLDAESIHDETKLSSEIEFSEFHKKYKLFKLVVQKSLLADVKTAISIFTLNTSKSGKRFIENSTNLVNKSSFSLRDPFSLLQDEKIWKMETEDESEIYEKDDSQEKPKLHVRLPMGWKEEHTGLLIQGQYASTILDVYRFPTQYWDAENGEKPTLEPIGWKSEDLLKYGITSDSMNKWLLSNQVADNWNKGLQQLRTNLSIDLPVGQSSPNYAALSPEYQVTSPEYQGTSPEYQVTSPEYQVTSPNYAPASPEYPTTSPNYPPVSPEYPATSPEYATASPVYPSVTPPVTEESILIAIPYNEPLNDIGELSGGGNVVNELREDSLNNIEDIIKEAESLDTNIETNYEVQLGGKVNNNSFKEKLKNYIDDLKLKLNEYLQTSSTSKNYKILVLTHNFGVMHIDKVNELMLPLSLIRERKGDVCLMNFNKGSLINIVKDIALNSPLISNIVFHEPFLLPNDSLVSHYFEPTGSCIHKLINSTGHNIFASSDKLGIFSLHKKVLEKINIPIHIWSYSNIEKVIIELSKSRNIPIKEVSDVSIQLTDTNPEYHKKNNVSEDNRIVIEDSILTDLNSIPQNEWYKIINITNISEHLLVESELKWNCLPLSSIGELNHNSSKYPLDMRKASNKISDIITELLEYIKFYINRIISTEINISIKKNILRISTDKMSRNDILSLVIRFDNQLKLFKSNIINSDNAILMLNEITKELLDNYEFSIFSDKDSHINMKFDQRKDESNTLRVKAISSNVNENSLIYNKLKFKNLDLSQEQRIKDIIQKIDNVRSEKIKLLKASQISEFNQKSAEFIENTSNKIYEKIYEIGDIVVLYDTSEQKIKYLNLSNMSITTKLIDDKLDLSDDEFLIVVNHTKDKYFKVLSEKLSKEVSDKEKQFYKDYTKGTKIIIKTGKYANKIAIIEETYLDSLDVNLLTKNPKIIKSTTVKVDIDNPENNVLRLDDIILQQDQTIEGTVNGSPTKKIALFDDYRLKVKFVVEDDDGHIDVVDSSKFKLDSKLRIKKLT